MPAQLGQDQLTLIFLAVCVVCATWWVLKNLRAAGQGNHWTTNIADVSDEVLQGLKASSETAGLRQNLRLAWLLTARGSYREAAEVWDRVMAEAPESLRGRLVAQKTSFHCEESRDEFWTHEDGEWAVLYSTILHGKASSAQRRRFVVEATVHAEAEEAINVAKQLREAAQRQEGHVMVHMRNSVRKKFSAVFDLSYSLADAFECVTENDGYGLLPFHRIKKLVLGQPVSCWVRAQLQERGSSVSKYILVPLIYRGSLAHEDLSVRQGLMAVTDDATREPLRHFGRKVLVGCNEGAEPQMFALADVHSLEFTGPAQEEEGWHFGDPLEAG